MSAQVSARNVAFLKVFFFKEYFFCLKVWIIYYDSVFHVVAQRWIYHQRNLQTTLIIITFHIENVVSMSYLYPNPFLAVLWKFSMKLFHLKQPIVENQGNEHVIEKWYKWWGNCYGYIIYTVSCMTFLWYSHSNPIRK